MGRSYEINEEILESTTEKQSYFLGFFVADGHLTDTGVRISSGDEESFKNLKICLNSEHEVYRREKGDFIQFNSKKIADKLRDIGFQSNKSHNLVYPDEVIDRHFIRGYFDGDGHVTKEHGYITSSFHSVDHEFLKELKDVLKKQGIESKFHRKDKNVGQLKLGQKNSMDLYEFMYPAEFYLTRKKEGFEDKHKELDVKIWSQKEIEFLEENYNDLTDAELADELDRSSDAVESKRLSLDLKKYRSHEERKRDENGRFV